MMYKCPKCNNAVDPNSPICPHCGERLFEQKGSKYFFIYSFAMLLVLSIILTLGFGVLTVLDIINICNYTYSIKTIDIVSTILHCLCFLLSVGSIAFIYLDKKEKSELSLGLIILISAIDLLYVSICMILRNVAANRVIYEYWYIVLGIATPILGIVYFAFSFFKGRFLCSKKIMAIVYGSCLILCSYSLRMAPAEVSYMGTLYTLSRSLIADTGIGFILYGALFYRKRMIFASRAIKVTAENDIVDNENSLTSDFSQVYDQLLKLKDLYDRKIITDEEYEEKRKELLSKLGK